MLAAIVLACLGQPASGMVGGSPPAELSGKWVAVEGRRGTTPTTKADLAKTRFSANHLDLAPFGPVWLSHLGGGRAFLFSDSGPGFGGGKMYRGDYEVKGDTLRVCVNTVPQGAFNPGLTTTFDKATEAWFIVVTFKREKK